MNAAGGEQIEQSVRRLARTRRPTRPDAGGPGQPGAGRPRTEPAASRRCACWRSTWAASSTGTPGNSGCRWGSRPICPGRWRSMGCGAVWDCARSCIDRTDRVIALSGDGAMQMTGLAELITVSRMWPEWTDPRFVVCVLNNGDLAEVSWEQREMEGDAACSRTARPCRHSRTRHTRNCSVSAGSASMRSRMSQRLGRRARRRSARRDRGDRRS